MASVKVSVSHTTDNTPAVGGIFDGLSFFLVQRLPSRAVFVQRIQANGGRIVKLETQADHIIADHFRKDAPTGSLSYTFIDTAINDGELPEPEDHPAGPPEGTLREVGSAIPGRSTRTAFTPEDDLILWKWVQRGITGGGMAKGNELYKQLEKVNPRHTYQSWRDRYIKVLSRRPPPGVEITVPANAPPSPPIAQDQQEVLAVDQVAGPSEQVESKRTRIDAREKSEQTNNVKPASKQSEATSESAIGSEFTEEDQSQLLLVAQDIVRIHPTQQKTAWQKWAKENPPHSARAWRDFWQKVVRPIFDSMKKIDDEEDDQPGPSSHTGRQIASQNRSPSPVIRKRSCERSQSSGPQKRARRERKMEPIAREQNIDIDQAVVAQETRPHPSDVVATQVIEILSSDESQETVVAGNSENASNAVEPEQSGGDLLTQENLAHQQAKHHQELLRDANLPQDDDDKDGDQQDEFRLVLEDVTHSTNVVQPHPPREGDMSLAGGAYSQFLNLAETADPTFLDAGTFEDDLIDGPMSSQQEIDEAFEANINWPASPKVSHKKATSQSLQFETQIPYPALPGEHVDVSQHEALSNLSSRASKETEISYPSLSQDQQSAFMSQVIATDDANEHDADELERSRVEAGGAAKDDDDQQSELASEDSSFVEDIDLSIPEPEGWNSSSPARFSLPQLDGAQPSKGFRTAVPDPNLDEAGSENASVADQDEAEEPQEISFDTSSSSASSSEHAGSTNGARASENQQRHVVETQDILNAETQQPDLAMLLPSDSEDELDEHGHSTSVPAIRGWTHSEDEVLLNGVRTGLNSTEISKSLGSKRSPNAVRNRHALLFKQDPDIHSPRQASNESLSSASSSQNVLPSDPLDLTAFPPPAPLRNLAESQNLSSDGGEAYEAYFIKKTQIEHYSAADVNEALRRTSMRDDLADYVLLEKKRGRGLPSDIPGIWTEEEDRICEGSNAKAMRVVEQKHGWDEVEARMEFLQELRGF